jgi:hypothetical protein
MNYVLHQHSTLPLTLILVRCDQLVRAPNSHATTVHGDCKITVQFSLGFFPLNRVIAKTRKVRWRVTRDASIGSHDGDVTTQAWANPVPLAAGTERVDTSKRNTVKPELSQSVVQRSDGNSIICQQQTDVRHFSFQNTRRETSLLSALVIAQMVPKLTARRVLLEKLTVSQLLNKYSAIDVKEWFIKLVARGRPLVDIIYS